MLKHTYRWTADIGYPGPFGWEETPKLLDNYNTSIGVD